MDIRGAGLEWRLAVEVYLQSPSVEAGVAVEKRLEEFGRAARKGMRVQALRDFGFGAAVGAGATDVVSAAYDNVLVSVGAFGAATVRHLWKSRTERIVDPLRTLPAASRD
jgi:hypothetical protein